MEEDKGPLEELEEFMKQNAPGHSSDDAPDPSLVQAFKDLDDFTQKMQQNVEKKEINVKWRKRSMEGIHTPERTRLGKRRPKLTFSQSQAPTVTQGIPTIDDPSGASAEHGDIQNESDLHRRRLREILQSIEDPEEGHWEPDSSLRRDWSKRQAVSQDRWRTARPQLLDSLFSAECVGLRPQMCSHCDEEAVIQCKDCLPKMWCCGQCDTQVHHDLVLHNRSQILEGFLSPIPPTTICISVDGKHQLATKSCLLPISVTEICDCETAVTVTADKPVILITMNGRYDLGFPLACCSTCSKQWTPDVRDLLESGYWPATMSLQTVYKMDVFRTFEHSKVVAPAFSRQAFVKILEQRSTQFGRCGPICGDTFQRSYLELCYTQHESEILQHVDHFVCPSCTPEMLAVSADGNRKHYRFKKSKGTSEPAYFEGTFLAKDDDVSLFVDQIRTKMKQKPGKGTCGSSQWTAAKEQSKRSSARLDEEGLEIAVCRHGFLLKGLNMFQGEIFAYPMFLQRELSNKANITFFCLDIACKYYPYLRRASKEFPEITTSLLDMKPLLSVMHAKAHTWKCEVQWGGRNQEGAGTTLGEEVEQVNSFLSRAALSTKYMTKAARTDMITLQAIGWNARKKDQLHKYLAKRYLKTVRSIREETERLEHLKTTLGCTSEKADEWVGDVQEWANAASATSEADEKSKLQQTIESLFISIQQKNLEVYRQTDGNKRRHRLRRKIIAEKKKLAEEILKYNSYVPDSEKININAVEAGDVFVWPWEHQGEVGLNVKRKIFSQVMLSRRLKEEEIILMREMSQHCQYLKKITSTLRGSMAKILANLKSNNIPPHHTAQGYGGLLCSLRRTLHAACCQQSQILQTYSEICTFNPLESSLPEVEEEEEEVEEEEEEVEEEEEEVEEEEEEENDCSPDE